MPKKPSQEELFDMVQELQVKLDVLERLVRAMSGNPKSESMKYLRMVAEQDD